MSQHNLRTYRRRSVTRESGYHTSAETTGGECILRYTEKITTKDNITKLLFERNKISAYKLFNKNKAILAFGGFIYCKEKLEISYKLKYSNNHKSNICNFENFKAIEDSGWSNIGFHCEIDNCSKEFENCSVEMIIKTKPNTEIHFCCIDFDSINKPEFFDDKLEVSFYQKTNLHIPYLYYLNTQKSIKEHLSSVIDVSKGFIVVLKSCNRCSRFLPINEFDELKTLGFSLHCKKRAPCTHATFRAYRILNLQDFNKTNNKDLENLHIENGYIISYFGHQLECKACKKFFVNAPLNPQRNAQQFKEDGLRRRAIEVLVNELLGRNLVHFEFEHRTKKEFSKYIWQKFNKKCFKCGKALSFDEMALDHTMPLAYLYRLDETATCLCSSHNSQKSDHFPVDYYSENELQNLSEITGLSYEQLHTREINSEVLDLLIKNVVWYFDDFLMREDYQKIRDGIKTADKINDSIKRVISGKCDLVEEYKKIKGVYPTSVTII